MVPPVASTTIVGRSFAACARATASGWLRSTPSTRTGISERTKRFGTAVGATIGTSASRLSCDQQPRGDSLTTLTGHRGRAQDFVDLFVREDFLFAHQLDDALVGFERLRRELGRAIVADDRVERRDSTDAVFDVVLTNGCVRGDPFDAVLAQRVRRVGQLRLALEEHCR